MLEELADIRVPDGMELRIIIDSSDIVRLFLQPILPVGKASKRMVTKEFLQYVHSSIKFNKIFDEMVAECKP